MPSWSRLCVLVGLKEDFSDPDEQVLSKGLRRFCHHNDPEQLGQLLSLGYAGREPELVPRLDYFNRSVKKLDNGII